MRDLVVIERRFNGPPDSAHGGYACGLLGTRIDAPAAEVTLRRPPPLEHPLELVDRDGGVALLDGATLVAETRPAVLEPAVPAPVSIEQARTASLPPEGIENHPFPTCFGCGPDRRPGDGLRLWAGPVEGRDLWATDWVPDAELADRGGEEGIIAPLFTWAALDCPSGAPAVSPDNDPPIVLGRLAARLVSPVRAGEPHAITSWLVARDGRKRETGVAIWSASGELEALGSALWIALRQGERAR